jgi:hypothetical protein
MGRRKNLECRMPAPEPIADRIAEIYRCESRRVLATLIRLLGDFDQAEEALQEAFGAALETWPRDGIPSNARAWLVSTGHLADATTHVRLSEGEVSVTDGPFIEGKELIPGFTVIRVDSKQEAIEWVTKLRRCMGDGELRMAQVFAPGFD